MNDLEEILALIPHRPPFLWVDRIVRLSADRIETEKTIPPDLELFKGHYPDYPLVPGVLLCEAVFQSGALLLVTGLDGLERVPVLTRIAHARFKREVHPGDTVAMIVTVKERLGSAWFMAGKMTVGGKGVLTVEFACALVERTP